MAAGPPTPLLPVAQLPTPQQAPLSSQLVCACASMGAHHRAHEQQSGHPPDSRRRQAARLDDPHEFPDGLGLPFVPDAGHLEALKVKGNKWASDVPCQTHEVRTTKAIQAPKLVQSRHCKGQKSGQVQTCTQPLHTVGYSRPGSYCSPVTRTPLVRLYTSSFRR